MESRRRASARWSLTDGVERVDGRVGDGDERDAVGAHLHGDPDRPRRGHGRSLARSLAGVAVRKEDGGGGWRETAREETCAVRECFKARGREFCGGDGGRRLGWSGNEKGRRRKLPRRNHSPSGV
jgi:hypothetical protein